MTVKERTRPGSETPSPERMIDSIARAICSSTCAYRGVTPCWSVHTSRHDAMEWPNPFCDAPGCHAIAADVYAQIIPKGRFR